MDDDGKNVKAGKSSTSPYLTSMADPFSPARSRSPKAAGAAGSVVDTASPLIGLDFDCTITVRHFYKSIANLLMGKPMAHPHCAFLNAWLKRQNVKLEVPQDRCAHGCSRGESESQIGGEEVSSADS